MLRFNSSYFCCEVSALNDCALQHQLMLSIRRVHQCMNTLKKNGFRQNDMVLLGLYRFQNDHPDEGLRVSELGKRALMSPPAMSRCLRQLENNGLIQRSFDPEDRRTLQVHLTEEGLRQASQTEQENFPCFEKVFTAMGDEDASELVRLMKSFSELLDKEIQSVPECSNERSEVHA